MNFKKTIFLGIVSGVLASIIGILYNAAYSNAFRLDFSSVLNINAIIMSSIVGCLLMAFGYFFAFKVKKAVLIPWLNVFYCVLSFVSIISVLSFKLPLDIEFPEMFPGLAVPMHFFPALSFLALVPFFNKIKD
jgi:hypothetical protein